MSIIPDHPVYVRLDMGQFGAYLTNEEESSLLDILEFYPHDDPMWSRLTQNRHVTPARMSGLTERSVEHRANLCRDAFRSALDKIAHYDTPLLWSELLEYWHKNHVRVSKHHDMRNSSM